MKFDICVHPVESVEFVMVEGERVDFVFDGVRTITVNLEDNPHER